MKHTLSKRDIDYIATLPSQIGDKVKLRKPVSELFGMFEKSKDDYALDINAVYTIKDIQPASSWTAVYFEEVEGFYNYHWFVKSEA